MTKLPVSGGGSAPGAGGLERLGRVVLGVGEGGGRGGERGRRGAAAAAAAAGLEALLFAGGGERAGRRVRCVAELRVGERSGRLQVARLGQDHIPLGQVVEHEVLAAEVAARVQLVSLGAVVVRVGGACVDAAARARAPVSAAHRDGGRLARLTRQQVLQILLEELQLVVELLVALGRRATAHMHLKSFFFVI